MEPKNGRMFLKEETEKKVRYLKRKQSEEEAEKALEEYLKGKGIPPEEFVRYNEQ